MRKIRKKRLIKALEVALLELKDLSHPPNVRNNYKKLISILNDFNLKEG